MATGLTSIQGGGVVGQALGAISTTKNHALGTRAFDQGGNEYVYLEGVASTVAGDWVVFDEAFLTARATETEGAKLKPAAIAQADCVASNYGWYAVKGEFAATEGGKLLINCAKEVPIYFTTTAGSADDAGTTKLNRTVVRTTITAAARGVMHLDYPSGA